MVFLQKKLYEVFRVLFNPKKQKMRKQLMLMTALAVSVALLLNSCHKDETNNNNLYNWTTVMNDTINSETFPNRIQGVCPTGWHVPSDAEWTQLGI